MPSWRSWQHALESYASLQLLTLCLSMFFWQTIVVPALTVEGSHRWLLWLLSAAAGTAGCQRGPWHLGAGSEGGRKALHPSLLRSTLLGVVWTQPVNPAGEESWFIRLRPVLKSSQDLTDPVVHEVSEGRAGQLLVRQLKKNINAKT